MTYRVVIVDRKIPPNMVEPIASLAASPAPGPILPRIKGKTAKQVLALVIMIARNLNLQAVIVAFWIFFPVLLSSLAQDTIRILFLTDIPIRITRAICEKIFMLELKRFKNKRPPNRASGTVRKITKGERKLFRFAARIRKAVTKANVKMIYISLLTS